MVTYLSDLYLTHTQITQYAEHNGKPLSFVRLASPLSSSW